MTRMDVPLPPGANPGLTASKHYRKPILINQFKTRINGQKLDQDVLLLQQYQS
jgi:hypothetical protein